MFVLPVTLNSCFKCRHCFTKNNFWILNKLSSLCVLKVRRSDSENENRLFFHFCSNEKNYENYFSVMKKKKCNEKKIEYLFQL